MDVYHLSKVLTQMSLLVTLQPFLSCNEEPQLNKPRQAQWHHLVLTSLSISRTLSKLALNPPSTASYILPVGRLIALFSLVFTRALAASFWPLCHHVLPFSVTVGS